VPLDLGEVVLRAVERAQRRDPGRRFVLDLEEDRPAVVMGDPAALERAALNLLDNALKFSAGDVEVQVRAGSLTVRDRGQSLPEQERLVAFERFWRAPGARELPGSGLGLAIVADVARSHGGEVWFRQRAGGGSDVGFSVGTG
jgi:two-component system sensor histidine kinase MprB